MCKRASAKETTGTSARSLWRAHGESKSSAPTGNKREKWNGMAHMGRMQQLQAKTRSCTYTVFHSIVRGNTDCVCEGRWLLHSNERQRQRPSQHYIGQWMVRNLPCLDGSVLHR